MPLRMLEKPFPKTATFENFEVQQEDWNFYKIKDETLLRAKFVLTGVLTDAKLEELERQAESGQKVKFGLAFRSSNIFMVETPPELRGEPDSRKYSPAELQSSIVNEDIDFETLKEAWNLYQLENGIRLKVRLSPVSINKTDKFDSAGMPIYTIDFTADVKIEMPERIRKLVERRKE